MQNTVPSFLTRQVPGGKSLAQAQPPSAQCCTIIGGGHEIVSQLSTQIAIPVDSTHWQTGARRGSTRAIKHSPSTGAPSTSLTQGPGEQLSSQGPMSRLATQKHLSEATGEGVVGIVARHCPTNGVPSASVAMQGSPGVQHGCGVRVGVGLTVGANTTLASSSPQATSKATANARTSAVREANTLRP